MQVLQQGKYSGNIIDTKGNHGLITSLTTYDTEGFNSSRHYHDNAHFSFLLDGGSVEKKKADYEIKPGSITYYSAGEIHQVLRIAAPTRRVNVEIEDSFIKQFDISDALLRKA